ncbi:AGE family epimerase/isomerase [Paraflavitalea speifideaquila]|uniref:AGE family epimerase/isomerase n=1 Tax=Paraflavitalea speifideaquila TaxID=3076558 RepID=UPI0028E59C25|nr:AGE family epimerase/isomerase [Paraflavitalea speifideiaquila]
MTVDHAGHPFDTKKQVYGQAFTLYAFCEYYKACRHETVKERAIELYTLIERFSYDKDREGYFEAFDREWRPLKDLRLSAKDANEKKSMNTHLHVLEAYTNLYSIWPDEGLHRQITRLINNFLDHIIHPITYHQVLFLMNIGMPAVPLFLLGMISKLPGCWQKLPMLFPMEN